MSVAVRELYKADSKVVGFANTFDRLRVSRHNVQYGGRLVSREEAEFVLRFAEDSLKVYKNKNKLVKA